MFPTLSVHVQLHKVTPEDYKEQVAQKECNHNVDQMPCACSCENEVYCARKIKEERSKGLVLDPWAEASVHGGGDLTGTRPAAGHKGPGPPAAKWRGDIQ